MQIEELWRSIPYGRKIAIWGAGMTGRGLLSALRRLGLRQPTCFIDRNPAIAEHGVDGIPATSPSLILEGTGEKPFVLVATALRDYEIADQLIATGWQKWRDFAIFADLDIPIFTIEIAGSCNLACPSCPRGNCHPSLAPPAGMMDVGLFSRIIDKILVESPAVTHISLYNYGDPLLHPRLPDILKVLHERHIFSALSTNFSWEIDLKKLVQAQPGELKISVSGFYQDTYARTHTGGDIRLVKANMYKLRHYMDRYFPELNVKVEYHLYRDNRGRDLEEMKKLCAELGFVFNPFFAIVVPVELILKRIEDGDRTLDQIESLLAVGLEDGLNVAAKFKNTEDCSYYHQTNINIDGSVALCCVSYNGDNSIIAPSFMETDMVTLEHAKRSHPFCFKCMALSLPQYTQNIKLEERELFARQMREKL